MITDPKILDQRQRCIEEIDLAVKMAVEAYRLNDRGEMDDALRLCDKARSRWEHLNDFQMGLVVEGMQIITVNLRGMKYGGPEPEESPLMNLLMSARRREFYPPTEERR